MQVEWNNPDKEFPYEQTRRVLIAKASVRLGKDLEIKEDLEIDIGTYSYSDHHWYSETEGGIIGRDSHEVVYAWCELPEPPPLRWADQK